MRKIRLILKDGTALTTYSMTDEAYATYLFHQWGYKFNPDLGAVELLDGDDKMIAVKRFVPVRK